MKNPAPQGVPIQQVLAKIENFFTQSFNLGKVDSSSPNRIQAAGICNMKPDSQVNFPASPSEIGPPKVTHIMAEAEFFEEDTSEFKFSIRTSDGPKVAKSLVMLLRFFMEK